MLSGVGVNKFEHPVMLLPLKNIKWFLTLLIFAMQETPVLLLGWEDPLEKGYVTHSSILRFPLWLSI